ERLFDMPPQAYERYARRKTPSAHGFWRFNHKTRSFAAGRMLRIELLAQATVRWSDDDWRTVRDTATQDTGLGVHKVDLPTGRLVPGAVVRFTFFWHQAARWEGVDFEILAG
ncbi:MAG: hypothetical protein ACREUK_01185, partial [Burkholderiales bacterium]